MPKLRQLSGDEVIAALSHFGFAVHSQKGSHVKLRRVTGEGTVQTLTVPRHKDLDIGTLQAIIRQVSRFVPEQELYKIFHTE